MQVKLKVQVRIPYLNQYINKDTKMEVIDERGLYYICSNEEVSSVFILKDNCEVVKEWK